MSMKIYQMVTDRIVEMLGRGDIPWRRPWNESGSSGEAVNYVSKRGYRGINWMLLNHSGFSSRYWMTYKQASERGGKVKKGSRGTPVVFWKGIEIEEWDETKGKTVKKTVPFLRYYTVFNLDQIDGIDDPDTKNGNGNGNGDFQPIACAEQVIADMPNKPHVDHGGNRAYYRPFADSIGMPNPDDFVKPEFYYSVFFHELAHSTGHEKRLDRRGVNGGTAFGDHEYSKEELVAEFAATFLCAHCRIEQETIENSAAYIKSWMRVLRDDPKMLVHAGGQAQKAADYILNKADQNGG